MASGQWRVISVLFEFSFQSLKLATDQWPLPAVFGYSLYFAVVVSVSNTVTSFTRTRPLVTLSNR